MSIYGAALEYILENEGGYVNDPYDSGGETNFGISKKFMLAHPDDVLYSTPIKELTKENAAYLYLKYFWEPGHFDLLTSPLIAIKAFDAAVNMGTLTSIGLLQTAFNVVSLEKKLKVDKILGEKTDEAINGYLESVLIHEFVNQLMHHYRNIVLKNSACNKFLNGWIKRAVRLPGSSK